MAQDLNSVILVGNITRDLSYRDFGYIGNGTARANVSIAVNRNKKNSDGTWGSEVSYFDVTIWGKMAENLKPYLTKGKKIGVKGFLKQDRWKDQDGSNHSRVSVIAEEVELLTPANSQNNGNVQQSVPHQNYQQAPVQQSQYAQQYSQQNMAYDGGNNNGDFPENTLF